MTDRLFHLETFGCKLNQLDGERIRQAFHTRGYAETDDPALAAVIVINACSVTHNAEKESRYRFRRAQRLNPDARIYLIGCIEEETETHPSVLPGDRKFNLPEIQEAMPDFPEIQARHVRPLIHIQTGCDLACSYCIVPSFRGPSRSITIPEIERQIQWAIDAGKREVVLTGIHLGTWGRDLSAPSRIHHLMSHLATSFSGRIRIRISSLDANEVEPELISLLATDSTICPHLHLPLQSGSDATLSRMRRRYTTKWYRQTLEFISAHVPDVCLGADVIVGFPGETDSEFEETCHFVSEIPLHYLHVFPFSPRHGTEAADMDYPVDEVTKKERAAHLRAISERKRRSFVELFAGTVRPAVLIYPDTVLTDNFIQVILDQPVPDIKPGSRIDVCLQGTDENGMAHGEAR